jgi:hypothetical protein
MLFWDPAFSGCDASCPANLLLVHGSRSAWDAVNALNAVVSAVLTVIVVILIVRHWRSARGWSRQAMVPLVWIALVIGAESLGTNVTGLYRMPPAVQVSDDGAGGASLERGSGLAGLADRVASAGGVLRVDSPPGAGTRLEADIPCP